MCTLVYISSKVSDKASPIPSQVHLLHYPSAVQSYTAIRSKPQNSSAWFSSAPPSLHVSSYSSCHLQHRRGPTSRAAPQQMSPRPREQAWHGTSPAQASAATSSTAAAAPVPLSTMSRAVPCTPARQPIHQATYLAFKPRSPQRAA